MAVKDMPGARDVRVRHGSETETTNLMDLARASGGESPHAKTLKEKHILIPVHACLERPNCRRMLEAMHEAGKILRPDNPRIFVFHECLS